MSSFHSGSVRCGVAMLMPNRPMSLMKSTSPQAIAMIATCAFLPLATSLRNRPHNRNCAFHARSMIGFGSACPVAEFPLLR